MASDNNKTIYTKKEALIRMLVLGDTMRILLNEDYHYYYLDGKFYRSGEGEWDTNDISNNDWVIS